MADKNTVYERHKAFLSTRFGQYINTWQDSDKRDVNDEHISYAWQESYNTINSLIWQSGDSEILKIGSNDVTTMVYTIEYYATCTCV
jgi:hypothetical protein